ncbi:uncharacterized protein [Euwallacea fornicatus]|uniref:uncharacterized protein n=1 Tax=Euwallacea fornicatus TaxID=995702 RepID=UPI0033903ECC
MNLLRNVRSFITSYFEKKAPTTEIIEEVGLIDIYFEKLLDIFLWHDIETSLQFMLAVNFIFLTTLLYRPQFYGFMSVITLIVFIYDWIKRSDLYTQYKGGYSSILKKVRTILHNMFHNICTLRRESPILYYPPMILLFWTLLWISKNIPLVKSAYAIVMFLFIIRQVCLSIPKPILLKIESVFNALGTPTYVLAEDELIPFIQGKDFNRHDADVESVLTDRTADSVTNSLISGISSMPSYLEIVESHQEIQEEDLIPRLTRAGVLVTPGELSSDSDSENKDIRFDSDHFNTSSSEDDPYSKDLNFLKVEQSPSLPSNIEGVGMIRSMISTVGGNLVANMFQSAVYSKLPETKRRSASGSDSDFELVDANELDYDSK